MKILILDKPSRLTHVLKACLNVYVMRNGNPHLKHDIKVGKYDKREQPDVIIGTKKPASYEGLFLDWGSFPSPIIGSKARNILNEALKQIVKEKTDECISVRGKKANRKHSKNRTAATNQETTVRKRGRPRGSRSNKQTL